MFVVLHNFKTNTKQQWTQSLPHPRTADLSSHTWCGE